MAFPGPASSAALNDPIAIEFSPDGQSLLLCDIGNQRVRSIDLKSRIITTLCGNGAKAPTPDQKVTLLYEALLSRPPSHNERATLNNVIAERGTQAIPDITHALITGSQFLFIQ